MVQVFPYINVVFYSLLNGHTLNEHRAVNIRLNTVTLSLLLQLATQNFHLSSYYSSNYLIQKGP